MKNTMVNISKEKVFKIIITISFMYMYTIIIILNF